MNSDEKELQALAWYGKFNLFFCLLQVMIQNLQNAQTPAHHSSKGTEPIL